MPSGRRARGKGGVVAVVAAMREELAPLERRLAGSKKGPRLAGLGLATGELAGHPSVLAVTGDGATRAGDGIEQLLADFDVRRLIAIGVAGGLSDDLEPGDLLIADRVIRAETGDALEASPAEPEPRRTLGGLAGTVVTAATLALDPGARAHLRKLHAPTTPAVVDLESWHYVAAAEEAGVPWTVLRVVSDAWDEILPAYLESCRDSGGSVRRSRVALHAVARPWTASHLLRLRRRLRAGAELLAAEVPRLLAGGEATP